MNKLFTKVAALTLGVAMAAGVGVAVGSAKASPAHAGISSTPTWSYDNASFGASYAHGTQTLNTVDWYLSCACNAIIGWNTSTQGGNNDASMAPLSTIAETTKYGAYQASGGWQVGKFVVSIANTQDSVAGTWYIWYSSDNGANWTQATTGTLSADTTELAYDHGSNFSTATRFAFGFGASKTTKVRITINEIAVYSYTDGNTYTVTDSVENGSVSPTSVNEGETLTATITPDTGYVLPETVSVTMGGTAATHTYENGVVTVNNVSGDIVISGSCPEKPAPQPVDLPDGDYTATLAYANPFPTEIDVLDGQSAKVAALTSSVSAVKTYDDTHHEYVFAKDAYFEINNLTNGVIKSISFNLYQYRNMNVFVDDSTTAVYTGDGQKGSGDPVVVEVETNAQSKIKVVSNGGSGSYDLKMYSLDINIKVGTAVTPVTGVSLNAQSGKIAVGTTRQLEATVAPSGATNKNVSWSAEPESVATVSSSGLVTGVAAGEAVITVATEDGGFTASYTATVGVPNYGTENAPLTVEEAREALEYTDAATTSSKLYVYGKVYSSKYSGTTYNDYTIWLTNSDESVDKYFEIYQSEISEPITSDDTADDALKGETVICHGYGKVHNGSTFELFKANDEKPSVAKYQSPGPTLESIAVSGEYKTKYGYQAEEFDKEGIVVTATYSDQSQQPVDLTDVEFSGYDKSVLGEQTVTVTYQEKTTTFKVYVYYTATYKPGEGTSEDGDYVEYIENPDNYKLVSFEKTGFVAPEGKQFKEWSQGTTGKSVQVNGNLNYTAVYEDIPASTWSDEMLEAFATYLHGVVPTYDDSVKTLAYVANYGDFEMPGTTEDVANANLATLCQGDGWEEENGTYYKDADDGMGYVAAYVYNNSGSYEVTIKFVQTCYSQAMKDQFAAKMHGNIPPFLMFSDFEWVEADALFASIQYTSASNLTQFQNALTNGGFTLVKQENTSRYVTVAQDYLDGVLYQYAASLQDGGVLVFEVFVYANYVLFTNIGYKAQPLSISVEGEYKDSYEYGEEFDPTGIVINAVMSDETVVDVTQSAQFSGFDSTVAGVQTITVVVGNLQTTFDVTINEKPAPAYDSDAFAKDLLDMVAPICANYDGKKNNKAALKTVWDTMSQLYSTLSNEEKAKVIATAAKADGTDLEKAMAFYDYACKKYGLTKFVEGRQAKALVAEHETGNSILPIVVIVASSVASITAIGVVIALKRRKALLAK